MAKAKRKPSPLGPIATYQRGQELAEQQSALAVITPEQRAKGTYEGDGRRIVNRGGTPVARWLREGKLTDTQHLAIAVCARLWALCGTEARTTATYGERISGSGCEEWRAISKAEAEQDLRRIAGYSDGDVWINGYIPRPYWQIFENVCRYDEPAGIAGSKLGFGGRAAIERAHTIVCMVADTIAMREGLVPVVRILVSNT